MRGLDRATSAAESPIRRLVGSGRLNPLPHAGTISFFLLIVVTVTGIYLTFFFEFGFADSYRAVSKMEAHPIQRVIRAVHRFSSAALVVTTLVHAWRAFVMQRFTGPRRWRWLTGVLALALVWLAGVTGYWLIWDVRAQALTEAFASMMGSISAAWEVAMIRPTGSGWIPLLVIFAVHLLLTAVIGYALWRHVRKTRHAWLPPRLWMAIMGVALLVVAIALPVGMLPAADPGVIPGSMPLDPFVMFLLPPLLGSWPWGVALLALAVGVGGMLMPWLLRRSDPPVALIVADRCTGCELCVIDCPYLALTMSTEGEGAIAVVDPERCVGCGICVGSCSFGAIEGFGVPEVPDGFSGPLVLTCSRLSELGAVPDGVVEVRCTGVLNPRTVSSLMRAGADSVQVLGCPPGDCVYGVGNVMASDRLDGRRAPLLPKAWSDRVTQDWVAPGRVGDALAHPGGHNHADVATAPGGGHRVAAVAVVVVSVVLIGLATGLPFSNDADFAEVRVVVDHRPGSQLTVAAAPTAGFPAEVELVVAGEVVASQVVAESGDRVEAVVDFPVDPGSTGEIRLVEGDTVTVLGGFVGLDAGSRQILIALDLPPAPGAELGAELFSSSGFGQNLGCEVCHSLNPGERLVGPSLAGIGVVAAERVPGMSAEEYLLESIVDPDAYTVEGFPVGQMLQDYEDRLTPAELEGLVAYLMTLTEVGP
jgi:ferredoxin